MDNLVNTLVARITRKTRWDRLRDGTHSDFHHQLTLNADFTGVPFPSVEWRLNGSPIAGATGHTLRLHNILRNDAGEYRITLSNSMGVVTGTIATLTVLQAPNTPGAADVSFDPGEALEHPGSANPGTSLGQPPLAWIHSLALQPDGSLDTQFTAAADDTVYDAVRLSDGRLAVGGAFSRFDNVLRNGIAVLYGDPALFDFRRSSADFSMKINTTPARSYTLEYRDTLTGTTWKAFPTVAGDGNPLTLTDPGPMPQHRFHRVRVN